jgi:hypothetical protein
MNIYQRNRSRCNMHLLFYVSANRFIKHRILFLALIFIFNDNILLIDGEEKIRSVLKRIITLEGYTVFEASTLKAAKNICDKE